MRPRPMNPQVARLLPLEANVLLVTVDTVPAAEPFPSMHSLEGENRIETAALILSKRLSKRRTGEGRGRRKQGSKHSSNGVRMRLRWASVMGCDGLYNSVRWRGIGREIEGGGLVVLTRVGVWRDEH